MFSADAKSVILATRNLANLAKHPYPGQLIVMGMDETGKYIVLMYALMGMNSMSRSRVLDFREERLLVSKFADPSGHGGVNPSPYEYEAGMSNNYCGVLSNGCQTRTVFSRIGAGGNMLASLSDHEHVSDGPHFTPRITGTFFVRGDGGPFFEFATLCKSAEDEFCERTLYQYPGIKKGFGRCLFAYSADADPLPPFRDRPLLVPLMGDIEKISNTYWFALNETNRVALVVQFIAPLKPDYLVKKINNCARVKV